MKRLPPLAILALAVAGCGDDDADTTVSGSFGGVGPGISWTDRGIQVLGEMDGGVLVVISVDSQSQSSRRPPRLGRGTSGRLRRARPGT